MSLAARAAVVEDRVLGETVPEGLGDVLPDARGVEVPRVQQGIIIEACATKTHLLKSLSLSYEKKDRSGPTHQILLLV